MVKVLDRSNLLSIDCNSAVDLSCVASSELTCPLMQQLIGSGLDRPSTWDRYGRLCSVSVDSCNMVFCPVLLYLRSVDLSSAMENRQNTNIVCYSDLTIRSECLADCLPRLDLNLHVYLFIMIDS